MPETGKIEISTNENVDSVSVEPIKNRWYALAVLVLVFTSSHVDRQIMGILLEPIKNDLGASDTQMGFFNRTDLCLVLRNVRHAYRHVG